MEEQKQAKSETEGEENIQVRVSEWMSRGKAYALPDKTSQCIDMVEYHGMVWAYLQKAYFPIIILLLLHIPTYTLQIDVCTGFPKRMWDCVCLY